MSQQTKDLQLVISAVIVPPPALIKAGVKEERYTKTVTLETAATELASLLQTAVNTGVFDQQGTAVNFLVQAPRRQPS